LTSLLAVLCRCDDYEDIADWAAARAQWLATFLDLPADEHGPARRMPHADTFERLFRRTRPVASQRAFIAFTQGLAEASAGRLIAIDGKTLRGSVDCGGRKAAIHMIHAWDQHNHLVPGQLAVEDSGAAAGLLRKTTTSPPSFQCRTTCRSTPARLVTDAFVDFYEFPYPGRHATPQGCKASIEHKRL